MTTQCFYVGLSLDVFCKFFCPEDRLSFTGMVFANAREVTSFMLKRLFVNAISLDEPVSISTDNLEHKSRKITCSHDSLQKSTRLVISIVVLDTFVPWVCEDTTRIACPGHEEMQEKLVFILRHDHDSFLKRDRYPRPTFGDRQTERAGF